MIVRNGHQTVELIRKGRRVDYVYREGKCVLGYEGIDFITLDNFVISNLFPEYITEVKKIFVTNIVSAQNAIKIVAVSSSITPVYLGLFLVNNSYELRFMSRYWTNSTVFLTPTVQQFFLNCSALEEVINLKIIPTSFSMYRLFSGCVSFREINPEIFLFSKVTNMLGAFSNCSSIRKLDLSKLDTSLCTNFNYAFSTCSILTEIIFSELFSFAEAITTVAMFSGCKSLTEITFSDINATKCTSFREMFYGCSSLERISFTTFDTKSGNDFSAMFRNCSSLTNINISTFIMDNAQNISYMFFRTNIFSLDLSNWDLSNCVACDNFLGYNTNLFSIKTPKKAAQVDIDLGSLFYNADGTIYGNVIPANSVGSVTIYRTPPKT